MEDNSEILIKKIEELNDEYLSSGEYSLGVYVKYLYSLYKNKKFILLLRMILLHFKKKKTKKKNKDKNIFENRNYVVENNRKIRIAVYSCITGNYDNIENPLITEKCCDYFLFTNNQELKSNIWTVKEMPENINYLKDNIKINRYIKMHPKELFPEYDYAIYIDGNVKLVSTVSQLIYKINDKTGMAIHRHCERNCIYDEIKACRAYGKGKYSKLKKQANRYKKDGFIKKFGMLECNMLISDLKNSNSLKIFNEWWKEFLNSESMRDQIALPYVLWKNNYKIDDIGNLGENIYTNYLLKINVHKNK